MTRRRRSLKAVPLCLVVLSMIIAGAAGTVQAAPQAAPPTAQAPKPAEPKKASPFENVTPAPDAQPPKPAEPKPAPPFERVPTPKEEPAKPPAGTPPAAEPAKAPQALPDVIEAIEFRGARRVPQDTLKALIMTKKGDYYDPDGLHRDFMRLWNTGRFDDISIEREAGKTGWIIRFLVTERRVVRSIKYEGNKSITVSEILDRFKERRVGLSVEQQYEQGRVQRATNVLKEFLSERGRQFASVTPEIRQIPPSSVEVTFKIQEGAKVKVGKIDIQGNKVYADRAVIRAMKNLRPIGVPHSVILESLFAKTFDSTKLEEDKERIRQFYASNGYFLARVTDHKVTMRDKAGAAMPFTKTKAGKVADVTMNIDEGALYRLNNINFVGVKLFRTPETLMRPFPEWIRVMYFSTEKLQKGLEKLRSSTASLAISMPCPSRISTRFRTARSTSRSMSTRASSSSSAASISQGNTTTRDKVIRRELLVDEGDMYNTRLWELSILRLNQLGYFEALKENESTNVTRDTRTIRWI
ncbi:MAG: POTRA domain-containing protein [Paludibaculum sp.]